MFEPVNPIELDPPDPLVHRVKSGPTCWTHDPFWVFISPHQPVSTLYFPFLRFFFQFKHNTNLPTSIFFYSWGRDNTTSTHHYNLLASSLALETKPSAPTSIFFHAWGHNNTTFIDVNLVLLLYYCLTFSLLFKWIFSGCGCLRWRP